MEKSKSIAAIVGPTLLVMVLSEMKLWNPTLYAEQIIPLIYLSGILLFVAGLTIVRKHNIWVFGWQILITVVGYGAILLGIFRMFFPQIQKAQFSNDKSAFIVELILVLTGFYLTYKAYVSEKT